MHRRKFRRRFEVAGPCAGIAILPNNFAVSIPISSPIGHGHQEHRTERCNSAPDESDAEAIKGRVIEPNQTSREISPPASIIPQYGAVEDPLLAFAAWVRSFCTSEIYLHRRNGPRISAHLLLSHGREPIEMRRERQRGRFFLATTGGEGGSFGTSGVGTILRDLTRGPFGRTARARVPDGVKGP